MNLRAFTGRLVKCATIRRSYRIQESENIQNARSSIKLQDKPPVSVLPIVTRVQNSTFWLVSYISVAIGRAPPLGRRPSLGSRATARQKIAARPSRRGVSAHTGYARSRERAASVLSSPVRHRRRWLGSRSSEVVALRPWGKANSGSARGQETAPGTSSASLSEPAPTFPMSARPYPAGDHATVRQSSP